MPTWPAALPQFFDRDSFSNALMNTVIKTQMDAGPPKLRRRITAGTRPLSGTMHMKTAQLQALIDFYNNDIQQALAFDFPDPYDPEETITVTFDGAPQIKSRAWDLWIVSLQFEIQP